MSGIWRRATHHDTAHPQANTTADGKPKKSAEGGGDKITVKRRHLPPPGDLLHFHPGAGAHPGPAHADSISGPPRPPPAGAPGAPAKKHLPPPGDLLHFHPPPRASVQVPSPISPMTSMPGPARPPANAPPSVPPPAPRAPSVNIAAPSPPVISPPAVPGAGWNPMSSFSAPRPSNVPSPQIQHFDTFEVDPHTIAPPTGPEKLRKGTYYHAASPEQEFLESLYAPLEIPTAPVGSFTSTTSGRSDPSQSPKSASATLASPPGSPRSRTQTSPRPEGRTASPRVKSGARFESPDDLEKRKRVKSDTKGSLSPVSRKSDKAERTPQGSPTNQMHPEMVLGGFHSEGGEGSGMNMDDILDPSVSRGERHDSVTGGAAPAPNIAPWLSNDPSSTPTMNRDRDASPPRSGTVTPAAGAGSRKQSLAHHGSMPALPRMSRSHTGELGVDGERSGESSRSGSQPRGPREGGHSSSSDTRESSRSRHGSNDSVHTLNAFQTRQKKSLPTSEPTQAPAGPQRQASMAGSHRLARFGSTASSMASSSGSGKEKKGLFGMLRRKNTASNFGDFDPANLGSSSNSLNSKLSGSMSMTSLNSKRSNTNLSLGEMPNNPYLQGKERNQSFTSETGMISPMQEIDEHDFHLDMNLDDMEGIVDPTFGAPPAAPPPRTAQQSIATTTTDSASSVDRSDSFPAKSSIATDYSSVAGSSGGSGPEAQTPARDVVSEADRQMHFSRHNPFSNSPTGSVDGKAQQGTPPSPYTLSPKHNLPPTNQPRRPSQLRNVKLGSDDSNGSAEGNSALQPLAPAWAQAAPSSSTVFNDPFGNASPAGTALNGDGTAFGADANGQAAAAAAAGAAGGAAWAAPESWGVEGDEDEDASESSSSSEGDGEWKDEMPEISPAGTRNPSMRSPPDSSQSRFAPPFGFKSEQRTLGSRASQGSGPPKSRGRLTSGRPSTASRQTVRPGTSGSTHISNVPHWIRIYRADGSFAIMAFPLTTSTAEILNILSGGADTPHQKKVQTNMRLYLRERGQDRMLLPNERPLAIQDRKLRQAGFTDAEKPEELGKEDLTILCKFIYQTPVLPVMDPDEENARDSYELIDLAGRDLQTIPIFLHLHSSQIVILNVSKNPMTDIPLDFIQDCTALKELRMTNMALKRVPMSIRASKTLSRLDFSSNRIGDLELVGLNEIETLTSLKVQNNKLTSIPTYFAQMKNLKYLNISNNKFETFPTVLCEMSTLVDLDVSFNNIDELPEELAELKSLEKLAVFGNELSSFPESFSRLANLRELDVRRNKLTDLTTVYALPNLQRLQADYNNVVTLDAQIGAKVRAFSVPHNSITRFTLAPLNTHISVNFSLTHLNLSHGKISTLSDDCFSGLSQLVELNLNFNQLTKLPTTLERLTHLEVMSCTDNMINALPLGLGKMQKLRALSVHNNNLKDLPPDIWGCSSLEMFNASSNLLEVHPDPPADLVSMIGPEATAEAARKMSIISNASEKLTSMPIPPAGLSLQRLYLGDNRFTDDVFHSTASMPNLKILNLSFNDIYEIPLGTLSNNDKLEALYLSGNKLTSLPSEDLEKLQKLRILHLNGNKLQTLPSELGAIKCLQHLDVGSNVLKYNIANWPYDWNWNWNTALRYLNLSGNKRLEIKPTSASDMSHASSFRKELSDFGSLTHLRVLGLMDVTLRIPSLPDENDEKRVRTSFSDINNMAYGISDMLGSHEHLSMFDLVVPNFRSKDNECIFGMFGRPAPTIQAGRIPKFLQESFAGMLASQLERLQPGEKPTEALRRTFLVSNRKTFEFLLSSMRNRKDSTASFQSFEDMFRNWNPSPGSNFRGGAAGAVVYLVDKTLYVGNVGDTLVVLSRKGEAELLSKLHDPTEREETARIRRAEAWVSPKGLVNEDKEVNVSRSFGYWQHFPAINADPEVRVRQLQDSDEFVIIGNQALWSCCSYQTAVDIARTEREDPMMAAQKLRDFAISYGANGSVMVMVVNISDLFSSRQQRIRAQRAEGAGASAPTEAADGGDGYYGRGAQRNVRRRYEEIGDRTLNRLQQEIEPPVGTVALVFTDIVNSTHLWETNPGMPTSIKIHHSLFRRQLRLDGGYEVKTEGDAFMVSFQTVTAALVWSFNCQILLLQQEWPRELLEAHDGKVIYDSEGNILQRGLRVRMGIHWGTPECERDPITRRMDYYGPMVNRAARVSASADGGQLMASLDVIKELTAVREYLDSLDEEGLNDLPTELKRHVQELRRTGLEVREMGERKLKGLEVPEKLHLLYPKVLAGRFEISSDLRANVEVNDARTFVQERQINIDEVRQMSMLVLRLEALCSPTTPHTAHHHHHTHHLHPGHAAVNGAGDGALSSGQVTPNPHAGTHSPHPHGSHSPLPGGSHTLHPGEMVVSPKKPRTKHHPPAMLGPALRDDMTDDELTVVLESLTTRIENSLSTLYLKQLGGFSSVLAALEQATKIDSKLLVHAMALMNGAMQSS